MKLKKLDVIGFKSFMEKTSISFPLGISAVVGPNGCGKSNVIDALRWVMGEQSVKKLRGKSMEDVIFSGANNKAPLNLAEVSLTLLNDNGSAPEELKDFSEIMVTRRLYRSGESGYFLNKQPCRLKDIYNVFLGSGMGAKSYAVIQQGNIGAITEAGPDERRFFIEEAAGITRYKNRKKEALRKVDATNQNLLRIKDIISEIKRQMAGLKRQVKKAERYQKEQEKLKSLDLHLSGLYYEEYSTRIEETTALLKDLEDSDIEHVSKIQTLDAAIEKIRLKRSQKNQEISNLKDHNFSTQRKTDKLENDLDHLRKDMERLSEEIGDLKVKCKNQKLKNQEIIKEISHVTENNDVLKKELSEKQILFESERSRSQNIKNQLGVLNENLDSYKSEYMDLVTEQARYNNIFQNASQNRENLKRRLKRADEEEVTAEKKVTALEKKKSQAESQLKIYNEEITENNKLIELTKHQLEQKGKRLSQQVKLVQTLEFERNQLNSQFSTLKKMEANLDWYKEGVKTIMKSFRGDSNKKTSPNKDNQLTTPKAFNQEGIVGLLTDVIEPEKTFETATESALGETLQYIMMKDQQACIDAIGYLQEVGGGSCGFIPVTSTKPFDKYMKKSHTDDTNSTDKLLNHVKVKKGFEDIAHTLLGHVVITSDIEEAKHIVNQNGKFQTIVAKDGNIISHDGIFIGGSKNNPSGILIKKKELKELNQKIAAIDQKLDIARSNQEEMETEARNVEIHLQKTMEQNRKIWDKEIEAEKTAYKISEDLKHAARHLEIVQMEQEQLLGEESDIDEELSKYNRLLSELSQEVKSAKEQVSKTTFKIKLISEKMDKFSQKTVDLKVQLTSLNARLENNSHTLKRLKEFHEDGLKHYEMSIQEIRRKNEKIENSKTQTEALKTNLSQMYNNIKQNSKELESYEKEYLEIEMHLNEHDNAISEIKNKRDESQQKVQFLEMERSKLKMEQQNIVNRLQERYHMGINECRIELNKENVDRKQKKDLDGKRFKKEMEEKAAQIREKLLNIKDVNIGAIKEYEQLKTRHDFLEAQRDDLIKAIEDLDKVIKKINRITQDRFFETLNSINDKMQDIFPRLFEGGNAKLILTEPEKPLESGVEFMIHPPGKKITRMSLLSGGEKALSAIAFIFSIFLLKPASFCLLDEIDAPLDEVNIYRFNELLKLIGDKSQIIMITHNKKTMEFADTLFGVTMEKKGISKIVSVNLDRPN